MRPRIIINLLALTCVVALAIAPAAGAMTDQGSPDAGGVAPTPSVSPPSDLRCPRHPRRCDRADHKRDLRPRRRPHHVLGRL